MSGCFLLYFLPFQLKFSTHTTSVWSLFTLLSCSFAGVQRSAAGREAALCLWSRGWSLDDFCKGATLCVRLLACLPVVLATTTKHKHKLSSSRCPHTCSASLFFIFTPLHSFFLWSHLKQLTQHLQTHTYTHPVSLSLFISESLSSTAGIKQRPASVGSWSPLAVNWERRSFMSMLQALATWYHRMCVFVCDGVLQFRVYSALCHHT